MSQDNKTGLLIALAIAALIVLGGRAIMTPRGIRNHNPGNIRRTGDQWQGLEPIQSDPQFFQFQAPQWGIRALMRILIAYQERHGLKTISQIINRWAPPVGRDAGGNFYTQETGSYIDHMARAVGVMPDDPINVREVADRLIPAMIQHENGQQPYPMETIREGIKLA